MMKKQSILMLTIIGIYGCVGLSNITFAETGNVLDDLSKKLETNKETLLNSVDKSKEKLKTISTQADNITKTNLFRAVSCLGIISEEEQNIEYDELIQNLKKDILNEYIELDGNIKRMSFGLTEQSPKKFTNTLDDYLSGNTKKITDLEDNYSKKVTDVKEKFLEYVDNNKKLLTSLAENLGYIDDITEAATQINSAMENFSSAINNNGELLEQLDASRNDWENKFEKELDSIISDFTNQSEWSGDIQAKFLIHKENFLKKYKSEIKEKEYYIFSALFSYPDYEELLEKKETVVNKFYNTKNELDCSLLVTTSFNLANYSKNVLSKSASIVRGLEILTNAINDGKIDMKILEIPTVEYFNTDAKKLSAKLINNFKLMLQSEIPVEKNESTQEVSEEKVIKSEEKIVFTQAFSKGQYNDQIKVLQQVLKDWGYYKGEITGVYSTETIESVYQFQLSEGIITGKEKDKRAYGRFGVATRERMNSLLNN